ncbi:MAG: type III secretion system chaperone [Sulfitobacter sp.]|nr:type III secretion system chaperone [Sulfitobacter sp.]
MAIPGESERVDTEIIKLADTELTRAQIDARLADLGHYLDLDELSLDEEGMAVLEMDDALSMSLIHLPGSPGLIVSAPVGNAELVPTELLAHLLQSNMDWELTQGGTLGVDPTGKHLLISRVLIVADRSAKQMDGDLAGFLELARNWRDETLAFIGDDDEPQTPGPSPEAGSIRV